MNKPDLEKADRKELIEYIEWASRVLQGQSRLKIQMALLCDVLADDIEKVSKGQTGHLTILTGEDKLFEHVLAVVKNKSDFDALTLITSTEEITKKKVTKMQDIVLNGK